MVPLLVWQAVDETFDWPMAAAMSIVTFLVMTALLAAVTALATRNNRRAMPR